MISPEGVFLSGSSYWYPHIEASLLSFDLAPVSYTHLTLPTMQ